MNLTDEKSRISFRTKEFYLPFDKLANMVNGDVIFLNNTFVDDLLLLYWKETLIADAFAINENNKYGVKIYTTFPKYSLSNLKNTTNGLSYMKCYVEIASVDSVSMKELEKIKPGNIILTSENINKFVTMYCNNIPVAKGICSAQHGQGKLYIKIENILVNLTKASTQKVSKDKINTNNITNYFENPELTKRQHLFGMDYIHKQFINNINKTDELELYSVFYGTFSENYQDITENLSPHPKTISFHLKHNLDKKLSREVLSIGNQSYNKETERVKQKHFGDEKSIENNFFFVVMDSFFDDFDIKNHIDSLTDAFNEKCEEASISFQPSDKEVNIIEQFYKNKPDLIVICASIVGKKDKNKSIKFIYPYTLVEPLLPLIEKEFS